MKAYLQNNKAQYYYIAGDGSVSLTDEKKHLQYLPEIITPDNEMQPADPRYKNLPQTAFVFRNDGVRILAYLFFRKGFDADCILTIEPEDNICGNLDFSTARVKGSKEIRICCIHF